MFFVSFISQFGIFLDENSLLWYFLYQFTKILATVSYHRVSSIPNSVGFSSLDTVLLPSMYFIICGNWYLERGPLARLSDRITYIYKVSTKVSMWDTQLLVCCSLFYKHSSIWNREPDRTKYKSQLKGTYHQVFQKSMIR